MRSLLAASLAAVAVLSAGSAHALDRRVTMVNATNETIMRLYGSNTDEGGWQEDVLGSDVLPAGESVVVDWDDGTGYCVFDFKAVFADGDESTKFGVNVCEVARFTFR